MKKTWMLITAIVLLLCATVLITLGVVSLSLDVADPLPPWTSGEGIKPEYI